jgi:hypothetical protein
MEEGFGKLEIHREFPNFQIPNSSTSPHLHHSDV